jgi:hypothetical protein
MSFKPDYGLRRKEQGYGPHVDHTFHECRLFSLTVLGDGQYSTTVDCPLAGEMHALSLDFTAQQLEEILLNASPELTSLLRDEISRDPSTPRTIDFEGEVPFAARARLGEIQQADYESFVPFVVQEILSPIASTRSPSEPDFACAQCHAPAGLLVQGGGFFLRCSKCDCPGPCSLLSLVADQLQSRYRAVLLSRESQEIAVVAEGVGADIVPQVLAAAADGKFVWMKPMDPEIAGM